MPASISRRLFRWLLDGQGMAASAGALPTASLFIGHTGLQWSGFAEWVRRDLPPALVFIHDLIPLTHPSLCRPGQDHVHARRMREALCAAQGVVVNSRHTADELTAFASSQDLSVPPICVAPLAPGLSVESGVDLGPPLPRPYFVVLGTVEARKNHALLLRLWRRWMGQPDAPTLVVIGQAGWEADEVIGQLRALPPDMPLRWLPDAGDEDVSRWLRNATALLMPSFAEGFGMPLAEALAFGVPALVSDLPALREVGGDVATYLSPHDDDAWYLALQDALAGHLPRPLESGWRPPTWNGHFETVEQFLRDLPARR